MSDDQIGKIENVTVALNTGSLPRTLKHHLMSAIYGWCVEEGHTPFIVIDVSVKREQIFPLGRLGQFINNNQIVFNIGPSAAINLVINKNLISFNARFGGNQLLISFSPDSVLGVFAKETRHGFFFPTIKEEESGKEETPPTLPDQAVDLPPPPRGKPKLTIVK